MKEGVWDFLPGVLETVKMNEDRMYDHDTLPTWRRLFIHKHYWIVACENILLPSLLGESTRTFLEIGGGLCYASALAKARVPGACVVATDVTTRHLRQHAVRAGELLGTPADVYAAADAENLPFEDGQFDAIFSQIFLYRVPDPVRALREIKRVLAPGGWYLGIERASPWVPPFSTREGRVMRDRVERYGIGERPIRYRQWVALMEAAWSRSKKHSACSGAPRPFRLA